MYHAETPRFSFFSVASIGRMAFASSSEPELRRAAESASSLNKEAEMRSDGGAGRLIAIVNLHSPDRTVGNRRVTRRSRHPDFHRCWPCQQSTSKASVTQSQPERKRIGKS